jgi:hypothetical protein
VGPARRTQWARRQACRNPAQQLARRCYGASRACPASEVACTLRQRPRCWPCHDTDDSTNLVTVLRGLERKGLIERHACPDDRRGVTVHPTERGLSNYGLVRHEWADAVSAAAGGDTSHLDTALTLLRAIEAG